MKAKKYIKYPFEYIAAQVEFGSAVARVTNKRKRDVFKKYTDIYGCITNHSFANKKQPWIGKKLYELDRILDKKYSPKLATDIYHLFLSTPYTKEVMPSPYKDDLRFGCFRLSYSKFYEDRGLVRLHFSPLRTGLFLKDEKFHTSDLSPVYLEQRQHEFKEMIQYLHDHIEQFSGATHFYSSTWMQNLSVYQSFFPTTRRKEVKDVYFWQWGQFMRWDYSGNRHRYEDFIKRLKKAKSLRQVVNCIPYKVYEIKVPLQEMFDYYKVNDASVNKAISVDVPLQFYTSHSEQKQTVC